METTLHLHLAVNTMRDGNGNFVQGSPQFTTTASKDFVKHILDKGLQIPTVSCSRTEGGCVYPITELEGCLLYTSPSPRDLSTSRMPSSA